MPLATTVDVSSLRGVGLATAAWSVVYAVILINQTVVKYQLNAEAKKQGKKFDRYFTQDRRMLKADRALYNMLEQFVLFMPGMWLYGVFVDAELAALLGYVYAACRMLYPILMGPTLGRMVRFTILFATLPGYLINMFFYGSFAMHAFNML